MALNRAAAVGHAFEFVFACGLERGAMGEFERAADWIAGDRRVKSRRGRDMTSLVTELAGLPDGLAVDGELVAFGDDDLPKFPRLCVIGCSTASTASR